MHIGASRRLVGGALVLFLALAGASCSSSKPKSSTGGTAGGKGSATTTPGPQPDPNGTINFTEASSVAFPTFNIHTYAGGLTGWWTYTNLYDSLIQVSASLQLEPMLATKWSFNSDSTQLTLQLRNDVKFQNGEAFNADDVVSNIQADAATGSNSQYSFASMTSVVAVSPYEVRLNFSKPDPSILYDLVGYPGMMIAPAGMANPSMLVKTPLGSGPYELNSISSSLTYQETRFDGYWNKSHVYPKYFNQGNISDETARFNAVLTGATDGGYITALSYPKAQADPSLQVAIYHGIESYNLYMNTNIAPLNNVQVRQAISMAIDRAALNASQQGLCPPAYQAFGQGMAGYINGYTGLGDNNVAQAKQMIQAAGANGATIKVMTTIVAPFPTLTQIVQAQLAAIGLKIDIVQQPGSTFRTLYSQGGYGMLMAPDSLNAPDSSQVVNLFYTGYQNPGAKDPATVAEIQTALGLPIGSSQRDQAFQQINKDLMTKDLAWAPLCSVTNIFVADKKVIGLNSMPFGVLTAGPVHQYLQISK
jgi:ABC-type transport system substrate-binding protein